ncbi:hypothetical protein ILUMI_17869 [Ignelater luminosus]|uniref:C2H2-type domain-containing protein n=1 Tax=Ignelater luminosus TaxID=2038154 RepID=A0A8K0CKZ1_IGNLU|nr:hypothetical protein ILUMI_17869 [Ignelater luminosus]
MMLMRESMKNSVFCSSSSKNTGDSSPPITSPKSHKPLNNGSGFECPDCERVYKLRSSLRNHQKWECGKEPQFQCPYCVYKAKQKMHMARHMERMHKEIDYSSVNTEMTVRINNKDSISVFSVSPKEKENSEANVSD